MKHRQHSTARGFTLIELLIVVAIIAIISAIAIPEMLKAVNLSKDKRVVTDMRNIAIAIGIYTLEYEFVPQASDIDDLITILKNTRGNERTAFNRMDAWGHPFRYYSPSLSEYTLKSLGKDGGEGNIANAEYFDPDADVVVISGVFRGSHQGTTAIVGN